MLPSNQQHNTIYRYRQLFSGAQCEVSLPSPQRPWEPRSSAAARAGAFPRGSRGCCGWAGTDGTGAPSPVVPLRAPAGTWKGPRGRRASPGVSAVPLPPAPAGGSGGAARSCGGRAAEPAPRRPAEAPRPSPTGGAGTSAPSWCPRSRAAAAPTRLRLDGLSASAREPRTHSATHQGGKSWQ